MRKLIQQSSLALALAAGLCISGRSQVAEVPTTAGQDQTNMLQLTQQFLILHQRLQAETAARDEQLRQLVAQMNSLPADQKLETLAAIVNKLVEEQLTSHQRKEALKSRVLQALIEVGSNGTNSVPQGTNQVSQPTSPASQPVPIQPATPALPPR